MATAVPETLKAELPHNRWGKVLGATPVIMTVVATLLAGLSSSEMTKAQYDRSMAAQLQSKAGDQWAFFQAKRLRGAIQSGTLDVLQLSGDATAANPAALRELAATLPDAAANARALDALEAGKLPEEGARAPLEPSLHEALRAIEDTAPEDMIATRVGAIPDGVVPRALQEARSESRAFDERLGGIVTAGDRVGDAVTASGRRDLIRDFAALRLRYASLRYDAEAALNRRVAALYEVQVRQYNLSAERHHRRSARFFYGMLAAQAAVIMATFAIAARQRNLLWSLAAFAGACAIVFAAYVFMYL